MVVYHVYRQCSSRRVHRVRGMGEKRKIQTCKEAILDIDIKINVSRRFGNGSRRLVIPIGSGWILCSALRNPGM